MGDTRTDEAIPLADLVTALRHELGEALNRAQGEAIRFDLGDIELELNVAVTREHSGSGGVQFWVLSLGGGASHSNTTSHMIRLTLHPHPATGTSLEISGSSPELPR